MPVFMTTDGDREFDRFNSPGIIYTQTHNTNIACSGSSSGGGSGGSGASGITNPFNGTLQVTDLETSDTFSLNDDLERIRNIASATETPEVTTMTGSLVIPNIKSSAGTCQLDINDTDIQVVSVNGDIQLVANDINLDATNVLVNGNPIAIGGSNTELELQAKTQNLSAIAGSTTLTGSLQISSGTTYDSSFLLALGQGSSHSIAYSTDGGDTWTGLPRNVLTFEATAATYGNGKWVAIGGSNPASIAYSSDGINWTAAAYPFTAGYGVHFANGLFVGLGNTTLTNSSIVTSTDGITWTGRGANIFTSYGVCVHYHDGMWVAGGVGTNSLAYSLDGTNWTGLGNSLFAQCRDVTYADGKWVAVGAGGANTLVTSPDGINWTGQGYVVFSSFKGIAFNGTLWVGVGSSGGNNSSIAYSSDLVTWTPVTDSYNTMYVGESVIWTGSKWIATGLHPSSAGSILTSPDGINWTETSVGLFNTGNGFGMKSPDTSTSSVTISDGSIQTTGDVTLGSPEPDTSTYTSHTVDYSSTVGSTLGQTGFSFKISEPINITHLMISTSHWTPNQGFTNEQIDVNNLASSGIQSGANGSISQSFSVTTGGSLTKIRTKYSSYNNNSYGTTTTMNIYSGTSVSGTPVSTSTFTKGADADAILNPAFQVTPGEVYTIDIANSLGIIGSNTGYQYKVGGNSGMSGVNTMSFATYVATPVSDSRDVTLWYGENGTMANLTWAVPDTTPVFDGYYELAVNTTGDYSGINLTDISQTYTFTCRININDAISSVDLDSTNLNSVITNVVSRFSGTNPADGTDPFGDPGYPTNTGGIAGPNTMICGNFKFTRSTNNNYRTLTCGNVYANNIIPSDHDSHNLGTESNRWNVIHAKTGYFAQQTIYLGDKWKLSVDETHPTTSSIKLSHASQGHSSGVIDNEVVLANPTHTGMVVNHTNLSGDTAKTSSTVSGVVEDYTAKVSILEGQPVALDIDSDIKVTTITSSTPAWQIVGVATNACNAGDIVEVCTKGFCNVRRVTTYESPTLKLLNSSTNNTTPVGLAWTFKDSGNDSNYSSNENYKITFDAQAGGTWTLTFNSFEFEHSTSSMYDRLGIQTSSDGVTFTNASISWMQKSATSTVPWSSSFAGSSWNSTSSKNGYIVPENTTRAILLGWDQQPVNINARYIRFTFFSDSSSNDPGWNITLVSSNYGAGNATVLPYGSPLYLDTSGPGDYTTVSTTGANIIAYSASADSSSDSIYCYIP